MRHAIPGSSTDERQMNTRRLAACPSVPWSTPAFPPLDPRIHFLMAHKQFTSIEMHYKHAIVDPIRGHDLQDKTHTFRRPVRTTGGPLTHPATLIIMSGIMCSNRLPEKRDDMRGQRKHSSRYSCRQEKCPPHRQAVLVTRGLSQSRTFGRHVFSHSAHYPDDHLFPGEILVSPFAGY